MKKIVTFLLAGATAVALSVSCGGDGGAEPRPPDGTIGQPKEEPKPEPEPEPSTHVTEYYRIVNQTDSDIIVELKSDDAEVITINPGETREIQKWDIEYRPGIAYSRSMYTVDRAVMTTDGNIVPDFIWLYDYWDETREDGEDDYHYTLTYTLTVTDELVESIVQRQASIMHVTTDYKIVNLTECDIVVRMRSGNMDETTVEPSGEQVVFSSESYLEPHYIESNQISLNADLSIDGEPIPGITGFGHWIGEFKYGPDNSCHRTYTLTVTEVLLGRLD